MYLCEMLMDWLRFDKRFIQFIKAWNLTRAFRMYGWSVLLFWPFELIIASLHFFGFSHIAQCLLSSRSNRGLNARELYVAKSMFGERLDYDLVRLNPKSRIAKKLRIAFVTGHQINFNVKMSDALLIHELTHVFQYQSVEIVYIPRCLKAQHSAEGYDFGLVTDHLDILNGDQGLRKLNYEQQADFLEALFTQRESNALVSGINSSFSKLNFEV